MVLLWNPSSDNSQNLHHLPHVVSQAGEVGLHTEVLQMHLGQNIPMLLRFCDQELSAEICQVSCSLSEKRKNNFLIISYYYCSNKGMQVQWGTCWRVPLCLSLVHHQPLSPWNHTLWTSRLQTEPGQEPSAAAAHRCEDGCWTSASLLLWRPVWPPLWCRQVDCLSGSLNGL